MKLPEYLLSTPRFIAVIVTIALVYLTVVWSVESKDFVAIATLIFWYFFWARGSETSDWKTEQELKYEIEDEMRQSYETPVLDIDVPEYTPKD